MNKSDRELEESNFLNISDSKSFLDDVEIIDYVDGNVENLSKATANRHKRIPISGV